jgi:Uma2 family endonuclease
MSSLPITTPDGLEPVWDIATLYPSQGGWSEEAYLRLTDSTNRLIEFTDGRVEFLPMPTEIHQFILLFLMDRLRAYVEPADLGKVMFSGLRVRVRPEKIREPDLIFISKERYQLRSNRYWSGADLVMEIVSPDDRSQERDHREKPVDYAEARIAEYWIVDPQQEQIKVLVLSEGENEYRTHGVYGRGMTALSSKLEGFTVDVTAVFDSPNA